MVRFARSRSASIARQSAAAHSRTLGGVLHFEVEEGGEFSTPVAVVVVVVVVATVGVTSEFVIVLVFFVFALVIVGVTLTASTAAATAPRLLGLLIFGCLIGGERTVAGEAAAAGGGGGAVAAMYLLFAEGRPSNSNDASSEALSPLAVSGAST